MIPNHEMTVKFCQDALLAINIECGDNSERNMETNGWLPKL